MNWGLPNRKPEFSVKLALFKGSACTEDFIRICYPLNTKTTNIVTELGQAMIRLAKGYCEQGVGAETAKRE